MRIVLGVLAPDAGGDADAALVGDGPRIIVQDELDDSLAGALQNASAALHTDATANSIEVVNHRRPYVSARRPGPRRTRASRQGR
jgi:hypothetical protein